MVKETVNLQDRTTRRPFVSNTQAEQKAYTVRTSDYIFATETLPCCLDEDDPIILDFAFKSSRLSDIMGEGATVLGKRLRGHQKKYISRVAPKIGTTAASGISGSN